MSDAAGAKTEIRAQDKPAEAVEPTQLVVRDSPFLQLTQGIQILVQIVTFALLAIVFFLLWTCYHRLGELQIECMGFPKHVLAIPAAQ